MAVMSIGSVATPGLAADLDSKYAFTIPSQPLSSALLTFSKQANLQVMTASADLAGIVVPSVEGAYTSEAALAKLLANTGLRYQYLNDRTVVVLGTGATAKEGQRPLAIALAQMQSPLLAANQSEPDREAAEPAADERDDASKKLDLEEIVVTGSRIVRDGYNAPTPLTIMGRDEINAVAPQNVADFVNQIPSVFGSATPRNSLTNVSGSGVGINGINLRGLGAVRTLVLLDGHRSIPSNLGGIVNVNEFPQQLISRVEVVTGGASSAYGSDAVSGVVNFILDKSFTGLKVDAEGGQTTYGDGKNWKVALSGGMEFGGGRGHLLLSGELAKKDGIFGIPRDWARRGIYMINNPAYAAGNGQPQYIVASQASTNFFTTGGLIIATPLRGTAFGPGGTPYQFDYGVESGLWMQGGQWRANQFFDGTSLDSEEDRHNLFGRASYEITDSIKLFAQVSRGHTESLSRVVSQFNPGNILIRADNPFIPAAVADRMTALGLAAFPLSTLNGDIPAAPDTIDRTVDRYAAGANGAFAMLGREWSWDVFYEHGIAKEHNFVYTKHNAKFFQAVDAVRDPVTGAATCRSTLTDPNNGCVPYNPMGLGVNTQATLDYFMGISELEQRITQDSAAANIRGEPFSIWAGPISIASGVEYRRQAVRGASDPVSQTFGWFGGNFLPTFGSYEVTEGYLETLAPLAKDLVWAKSLELNTAVRFTNYSTSGSVVTWKVGATYSPIEDLRLRVTRSRDIRAPNLSELYLARTASTNNFTNPFTNSPNVATAISKGNPTLDPEEADTLGMGLIYQPSWAPGLNASADYYTIDINEAIGTVGAQSIIDRCYSGSTEFCSALTFSGGAITEIEVRPFNFVKQKARGLDLELSYGLDLKESLGGTLTFRGLATRFFENSTNDGLVSTESVGAGPSDWSYRATVAYNQDPFVVTLTGRGISDGVNSTAYIECSANCPASTALHPTVDNNHRPGAFYLDTSIAYRLSAQNDRHSELFFSVQNLLNRDPPIYGSSGPGVNAALVFPANPTLYDVLGRTFRVGVRLSM